MINQLFNKKYEMDVNFKQISDGQEICVFFISLVQFKCIVVVKRIL